MKVWVAPLLLLTLTSPFAAAFPNGAGACPEGEAAVAGEHVSDSNGINIQTGELEDGGFQFAIGGQNLGGGGLFVLVAGEIYDWSLSGPPFRGFLVRLEGNSDAFFDSGNGVQPASACFGNVAGLTHTNSDARQQVGGTLMLDEMTTGLSLDVTVVVENRMVNEVRSSIYYYSGLEVDVIQGPTIAPTKLPTESPTEPPTGTPMNDPSPFHNSPINTTWLCQFL
jgi:hypothetical protein